MSLPVGLPKDIVVERVVKLLMALTWNSLKAVPPYQNSMAATDVTTDNDMNVTFPFEEGIIHNVDRVVQELLDMDKLTRSFVKQQQEDLESGSIYLNIGTLRPTVKHITIKQRNR